MGYAGRRAIRRSCMERGDAIYRYIWIMQQLSFTTGTDSKGKYVLFTMPSLQYWDMVYMKRAFTTPANDIYEAEGRVKVDVGTSTNHTGYFGSGFVDAFEATDGLTFTVRAAQDNDCAFSV